MEKTSDVILRTGRPMPVMGLGTWQMTEHTAETIEQALHLGYRMIDTSGDYKTQPGVGEGIKNSHVGRHKFYLVTKVEETDDAYEATRRNLNELNLDFVDLMLIHRPPRDGRPGIELWNGLIRAKKEGLIKDIGVSNYTEDQIETLADATGEMPVVNQIEWSPFGHSPDMLNFCRAYNIIIQAYSPLTRGKRMHDHDLEELAARLHKTPAQILIRWNLQMGTVPIIKAGQLSHLQENIDVFDFELSQADMKFLNALNEEYSTFGSLVYA